MTDVLKGRSVAILVANGFDEIAMTEIQKSLTAAGAKTVVVAPESNLVNGWHGKGWGHYFPIDVPINEALGSDFDAIVVPGGSRAIDKLARNPHATRILRSLIDGWFPVVTVGDGTRLLAVAERAEGRCIAADDDHREALSAAAAEFADGETLHHADEALLTVKSGGEMPAVTELVIAHLVAAEEEIAAAA